MESFISKHKSFKRALPNKMVEFKHEILLHKLYNQKFPNFNSFSSIITTTAKILESHTQENESLTYEIIIIIFINNIDKN